jgi:predicted PolB exonuclease-like 3'-5' exonuclease
MIQDLLLLDIETVPMVNDFASLSPEWQSLWWDKISKTVPENTKPEDAWMRKAGILAEFGKIICISTAYFYEDDNSNLCLKIKSISGDNEIEVLNGFTELCNKMYRHNKNFQFGGHNIKEFDIPYICRRLLINRLPLPEYLSLHDKKPWEVKMFDTLNWWKFGDNKNYITLHLLATVLGIPTSKTDIDGSMVQQVYYKDKDLNRIVEYCQRDVVVTANIILRFKDLPLLADDRVNVV